MNQVNQGSEFKAKQAFAFKANGKGRTITIKPSDVLWVTNTKVNQTQTGYIVLGRKTHSIGQGYSFTSDQVESLFEAI